MTSKANTQRAFFTAATPDAPEPASGKKRKNVSVYDAVAGRVSTNGFMPKQSIFASTRDTASSSTTAATPEEVLFRRKNAPTRFAEHDIYFASDRDPQAKDLPDSDMLKALHAYASDFYSHASPDGGSTDWRSLDETALIALGILMEEVSRLGKTSDLGLTEGEIVDLPIQLEDIHSRTPQAKVTPPRPRKRSKKKRRTHTDEFIE